MKEKKADCLPVLRRSNDPQQIIFVKRFSHQAHDAVAAQKGLGVRSAGAGGHDEFIDL
jgi:hypothetical protein